MYGINTDKVNDLTNSLQFKHLTYATTVIGKSCIKIDSKLCRLKSTDQHIIHFKTRLVHLRNMTQNNLPHNEIVK